MTAPVPVASGPAVTKARRASLLALVDAHFFGDGPHPLQLVCLTEDASDVECNETIALVEPGVTWDDLEARIVAHAAEYHAASLPASGTDATPGQAARAVWNDHWAGPDPYPAHQTQEETFEAVWERCGQAAIDAGTGILAAEITQLRAERAELIAGYVDTADRDEYQLVVAEITALLADPGVERPGPEAITGWRKRAGLEPS